MPLQNLPGFRQIMLLLKIDELVVFQHLVEGKEESGGDLVAHREGLQTGQPGVLKPADAAFAVAFDQDALVLIDDPAIVGMLVHDIDADAFLLIVVDSQFLGQFLKGGKIPVGDHFAAKVPLLKSVLIPLVLFVDQLDHAEKTFVPEQPGHFVGETGVVPGADEGGALEKLPQKPQDLLLLLAQGTTDRAGEKEEVITDRVALEKNPLVALAPFRRVGEEQTAILPGGGPEQDQAIANIPLGQIGQGLVDPEHVLAKSAAVPPVDDPPPLEETFAPRGKEPQRLSGGGVKVAQRRLSADGGGEEFERVVQMTVKPDFLVHEGLVRRWAFLIGPLRCSAQCAARQRPAPLRPAVRHRAGDGPRHGPDG